MPRLRGVATHSLTFSVPTPLQDNSVVAYHASMPVPIARHCFSALPPAPRDTGAGKLSICSRPQFNIARACGRLPIVYFPSVLVLVSSQVFGRCTTSSRGRDSSRLPPCRVLPPPSYPGELRCVVQAPVLPVLLHVPCPVLPGSPPCSDMLSRSDPAPKSSFWCTAGGAQERATAPDAQHFVSSVAWTRGGGGAVAANSQGHLRVLQLV